jgi:hypothetical protein
MTTTATHNPHNTTPMRILFVAFERREKTWKLRFTTGHDTVTEAMAAAQRPATARRNGA